ncbi:MAG: replicative DNA helicase [Armatimonadetes bacterium]|nr:MAG: replicative DNA helicase [Armatimonadota bacterium]
MAQSKAKLPPQNIDAEQSLLGGLLIDKDSVLKVAEVLHPSHFYRSDQHGKIYEAILSLFEKREPIDLVTVTEKLKATDALNLVGGSAYLTNLVNTVPTAAHIEHYARIIKEHATRRTLIATATRLVETAYDESVPVEEVLESAEQSLFSISQQNVKRDFVAIKDLLTMSFDRLDELQKSSGKLRGIPTGFRDLDSKTAGFQDSNLIIFAARPGQGKCLVYDSTIVDPDSGEVRTIEEYYLNKIKPILTLREDLKLAKATIMHYVDDGQKEVFEVVTATGRQIGVTLSHPFFTIDGWKRLEQLKVGDRIATPRVLPIFGNLEWEDYKVKALAYFLTDGGLTSVCPRFTNSNTRISEDFINSVKQFGGVQVRKYSCRGKKTPSYEVVKDKVDKIKIKEGFSCQLRYLRKDQILNQCSLASTLGVSPATVSLWMNGQVTPAPYNMTVISNYFHKPQSFFLPEGFAGFQVKNTVTLWLESLSLMGKSALDKSLPKEVFKLSKSKLSLLLNRMFACDGCISFPKKGASISYASSSKKMIYEVQHLLLRFGIISSIRLKKIKYKQNLRYSYELEIEECSDIIKFCSEIGVLGKEDKVDKAYLLAKEKLVRNNFTKDTIPVEIWEKILNIKGNRSWRSFYTQMGLSLSHNLHVGKRNPKRQTLLKIAQALPSQELENLATSDIFWDKIVSIKSVGKKQVYDLTIPGTHNFVANDFFVHNTSFVLNVAEYVAVKVNMPVAIFSLEMSQEELVDRILVAQAEVDSWKLKTGKLDEADFDRLSHAMGILAEAPLYIDDSPGLSLAEIRTKARRLQMEHGLKLLIVDYLQLIHGRNTENRVQEVSEISQGLKNLARELKIPVLAVSQLSRAVESRGTRKPQLADLRDSGAIEQDADIVMFIYREDPENMQDVTLDIQKHRSGPTGEIKLMFIPERTKFYGMEKNRSKPKEKD